MTFQKISKVGIKTIGESIEIRRRHEACKHIKNCGTLRLNKPQGRNKFNIQNLGEKIVRV